MKRSAFVYLASQSPRRRQLLEQIGVRHELLPRVVAGMFAVLLLAAFKDGASEELVVCAFLLTRLRQLGWSNGRALGASAVLRGLGPVLAILVAFALSTIAPSILAIW